MQADASVKQAPKQSFKDRFFGRKTMNKVWFFLFLIPVMVPYLLMVIIPFVLGAYYSFTDWRGGIGDTNWIGLANYRDLLSNYRFIYSFIRTGIYAFFNVVVINFVAFSLALLVTRKLKLTNIYRAGFFMPNLIGGLIIGFLWRYIFNYVLGTVGFGIFSASPLDNNLAMMSLVIVVTWQYAGYIMMIYVAALQNIPEDLVEASQIDGANALQRLRNIVLPLVAPAFTVSMFLTLVTAFKQFDTVFSLTSAGPVVILPDYLRDFLNVEASLPRVRLTGLLAYNIYDVGFTNRNFAFAQAQAVTFFVLLAVLSLGQVYFNKKREVEM